jgi:glucokinase
VSGAARLLALDVGGTKLRWGLVDGDAVAVLSTEPTPPTRQLLLMRLAAAARQFITAAGGVAGVAVSATGQIDDAGVVVGSTPVIKEWLGTPLGRWLSEQTGVPVTVLNDAKAAALAHWHQAVPPGSRILLVSLGTGVGAGVVDRDGRVELGTTGRGGELGHTLFRYGGRPCICGRRGCVEAYLSGPQLTARAASALGVPAEPAVWSHPSPRLTRFLGEVGRELADVLTAWDMIFECDAYFLAGGLTVLLPRMRSAMDRALRRRARLDPARVHASPLGDEGFLLGAAIYWRQRHPGP